MNSRHLLNHIKGKFYSIESEHVIDCYQIFSVPTWINSLKSYWLNRSKLVAIPESRPGMTRSNSSLDTDFLINPDKSFGRSSFSTDPFRLAERRSSRMSMYLQFGKEHFWVTKHWKLQKLNTLGRNFWAELITEHQSRIWCTVMSSYNSMQMRKRPTLS